MAKFGIFRNHEPLLKETLKPTPCFWRPTSWDCHGLRSPTNRNPRKEGIELFKLCVLWAEGRVGIYPKL